MKQVKTWSWGFVPAALALGMVWYEYWQSGHVYRAMPEEVMDAETAPADMQQAAGPSTAPASRPDVPATVAAPPRIDPRLLTDPPPISLAVADADLTTVARALSEAAGVPGMVTAPSPGAARYTLNMKDKPFWDVFEALQAQGPFMTTDALMVGGAGAGAALRLAPVNMLAALPREAQPGGIRHFERHGPAILYAQSISVMQPAGGRATMMFSMGTVIDPRLKVTRRAPILVVSAQDETGRVQAIPETAVGDTMQARLGNAWSQSVTWPVTEALPKRITFHCLVRFGAEISSTAPTVTVEDVQSHSGEIISLGDQQIRIALFRYAANRITVQLAGAAGGVAGVNFMVYDAQGKAYGNPNTMFVTATLAAPGAQPPFRLVLRGATGETQTLTYAFDLADIQVP